VPTITSYGPQQLFGRRPDNSLRRSLLLRSCFAFLVSLVCVSFGYVGKMLSSATDEGNKAKTRVFWNVVKPAIVSSVFVSFVLLFGCAYFSLRCQIQQLSADVDRLKAVRPLSDEPAAAAVRLGDDQNGDESSSVELERRRRSNRHDTVNETAPHNVTSDNDDKEYEGSGEFTGIWMGTYSRVPVS